MTKCPYCGRRLREHERYCDFCEQDLSESVNPIKHLLAKLRGRKKVKKKAKEKPQTARKND